MPRTLLLLSFLIAALLACEDEEEETVPSQQECFDGTACVTDPRGVP